MWLQFRGRTNKHIVGYTVEIIDPIFKYKIDTVNSKAEIKDYHRHPKIHYRYEEFKVQDWSKFEAAYSIKSIQYLVKTNIDDTRIAVETISAVEREPKFVVTYYKKKPKDLQLNFYNSNCKITLRPYSQESIHYLKISMVQNKLNEYNYNLEVTNQMNEQTKLALQDYQTSNGLPIGQLDYETLHSLELDYETMVSKGVIKEQREVMKIKPTSNTRWPQHISPSSRDAGYHCYVMRNYPASPVTDN